MSCYELKAEELLIIFFDETDKTSVTLRELQDLAEKVKEKCNWSIVTCITYGQLYYTVKRKYLNKLIKLQDLTCEFIGDKNDQQYKLLVKIIKRYIPSNVLKNIIETLNNEKRN